MLSTRGLAKLLSKYKIAPKNQRFPEGTRKGYLRNDFERAWEQYLPNISGTSVHKSSPPHDTHVNAVNGYGSDEDLKASLLTDTQSEFTASAWDAEEAVNVNTSKTEEGTQTRQSQLNEW